MKFKDIEKFTEAGSYEVDIFLDHLLKTIEEYIEEGLELNPDFQRGHVWTEAQQIAYVEYFLKGGKSGRVVYFNNPDWMDFRRKRDYLDFVCVDGLQRITALMKFLKNEIKVFGYYYNEFEDSLGLTGNLKININNLQTKKEVLRWYLEMNTGGTVHTKEEIDKVKKLLEQENE